MKIETPVARVLARTLRLPSELALVFAPIAQLQHTLYPQEQEAICDAVAKRRREFVAGRTAARMACVRLGIAAGAIPVAQDRTPIWPEGVVGSIAHSDASCLVVVGRTERWRSIGVDVETVGRVTRDLWPLLFCADECVALERQCERDEAAATVFFCLKEAFFKLQYGVTRCVPDPRDLRIAPAAEGAYRLWLEPTPGERYETVGRTAQVGKEMIALCLDPRTTCGDSPACSASGAGF